MGRCGVRVMRKELIFANWKMHMTNSEAVKYGLKFRKLVAGVNADIGICPPFTALSDLHEVLRGSGIRLGAQDVFYEEEGAYTSGISPHMLANVGVEYVIIGHSERRNVFGDTYEIVNKKLWMALRHRFKVILCIGEDIKTRKSGKTNRFLRAQLKAAFKDIPDVSDVSIAYEPLWAIGTGKTATPKECEEEHKYIRSVVRKMYGDRAAEQMRIIYGGSVKPSNAHELKIQPDNDGALVGGASLDVKSFAQIVTK